MMGSRQRKPKITEEQRVALLTWLAADYSEPLIRKWFEQRGWEPLAPSTISYHRDHFAAEIESAREVRRAAAITTGLALKEERVERLKDHADELDAIKWVPDKNGRLWNEAAWRDTLDDIAKEMGHRKTTVDVNGQIETTVKVMRGVTMDDL
jgi:hypothetical protein